MLLLSIVLFAGGAARAQTPVFYRVGSASNGAMVSFSGSGRLAWTNEASAGRYEVHWAFDLRPAGVEWEPLAFGESTGLVMSCAVPRPSTPRPAREAWSLIPAGVFQMGNHYTNLNTPDERPVHDANTAAFYIQRREVSLALWEEVRGWALTNGYEDLPAGTATATNHPVQTVSWQDSVKWCNARSLRDGLTPVYCTDAARTNVYRTGVLGLSNDWVRWDANGYRLPTEAEWEKAARGGWTGHFYPWPSFGGAWSNHIGASNANYKASGDPWDTPDDWNDIETTPAGYYAGGQVISGAVQAVVMTNGYGLFDAAGNVYEWCWDRYDASYYSAFATNAWPADPRGPTGGATRVLRGGSWDMQAASLRCANRFDNDPEFSAAAYGFRCARGL